MHGERGDVISSWLVQLLLIMAVVGLIGYELLTVGMAILNLDGDADQVASTAAHEYSRAEDIEATREAADMESERRGVDLVDLAVQDAVVVITVTRPTNTLFVHRIPGLRGLDSVAATRRSRWRP